MLTLIIPFYKFNFCIFRAVTIFRSLINIHTHNCRPWTILKLNFLLTRKKLIIFTDILKQSQANIILNLAAMMEDVAVDMFICVGMTFVWFKNSNNSEITET